MGFLPCALLPQALTCTGSRSQVSLCWAACSPQAIGKAQMLKDHRGNMNILESRPWWPSVQPQDGPLVVCEQHADIAAIPGAGQGEGE